MTDPITKRIKKMLTFDTIVFAIIGISGLIGFIRGFTQEILGIFAWALAIGAAYLGYPYANHIASQYISNPNIANAATFLGIFICFLILFSIVSSALSSYVKQTMLSGIDRTLGFGIGLLRAFFLFAVLDIALGFFFPQEPAFLQNSKTLPHIHSLSKNLYSVLPEEWKKYINTNQKSAKDLVEPKQNLTPEQRAKQQEQNAQGLAELKPQSSTEQQAVAVGDAVSKMIEDGQEAVKEAAIDAVSQVINNGGA